jgi:hypothetical protein
MALVTVTKNKEAFIEQLASIAVGECQTYDGDSGQSAIEAILSTDNKMVASVKYDALLSEIIKEHNLRAKKYIPQLCELLKLSGFADNKIVNKVLRDFENTWCRATVYNHIPDIYKRHYPKPDKSNFRHYAKTQTYSFTLDRDAKAGTTMMLTVNPATGEVIGVDF